MEHVSNDAGQPGIGDQIHVGSHGYVQLVDVLGSDTRIVDAARISYGRHERDVDAAKDRTLLRYLMRHRHTTPFEQAEMVFIIKVPMDTWRQWIRHRTASVNEYSTRYTEALNEMERTSIHAWRLQDQTNKQGSDDAMLEWDAGAHMTREEELLQEHARRVYDDRLQAGVAKEQARKDLPLSTYTVAYWKMDVHNLMHFLALRMDPHAQLEIRQYANTIFYLFQTFFPVTAEAFRDYRQGGLFLSRMEVAVLREMLLSAEPYALSHGAIDDFMAVEGLSKREMDEFTKKLERLRG